MSVTKQRFFSWWIIIIFTVLTMIALTLLFPRHALHKRIMDDSNNSPLSIAYLKSLIATHPDKVEYKIALIRKQLRTGHVEIAKKLLAQQYKPPPFTTKKGWQFQFMKYRILRMETFSLRENTAQRSQYETELRAIILTLKQSPYLTAIESAQLGHDALATNQPELAMHFYRQSLKHSKTLDASFYAQVGKAALFVSDYKMSAKFYLIAVEKYSSPAKQRECFGKALASLQAGQLFAEGMALIEKNQAYIEQDRQLLMVVASFALSANQPKLAERYVTQLIRLKYL
ncbi:MAG: hypothetical protein NXI01_05660 [Gammaproteobacteria bacterium]|nr:hypothetical protein [Gammaproteobacteria bacterium]